MGETEPLGYLRISDDREGQALGVERQREDIVRLAAAHGQTLRPESIYVDNDTGASTLSKKPRPGYARMVERIERGGKGRAVFAYSNSRLTRRPLELEGLIKLHDATGVVFHTCVSGTDDLSTADGRMVARIKASVDAAEAERIGERVRRKIAANEGLGKPGGGTRPFGMMPDRISHDPREVDAIRWAYRHLMAGGAIAEVARHWNAEGVYTPLGKPWQQSTVRKTLRHPRLKGERWKGSGSGYVPVLDDAGRVVKAQWAPILPPADFDALQAHLDAKGAKWREGKREGFAFLVSGVARCGACGGKMRGTRWAKSAGDGFSYNCLPVSHGGCGKVSRTGWRVDKLVTEAVQNVLEAHVSGAQRPVEAVDVSGDIARLEARLGESLEAWKAGYLSGAEYFPLRASLETELRGFKAREMEAAAQQAREGATVNAAVHWGSATLPERRTILEALVTAVVIHPLPVVDGRKVTAWNPRLIEIIWQDA